MPGSAWQRPGRHRRDGDGIWIVVGSRRSHGLPGVTLLGEGEATLLVAGIDILFVRLDPDLQHVRGIATSDGMFAVLNAAARMHDLISPGVITPSPPVLSTCFAAAHHIGDDFHVPACDAETGAWLDRVIVDHA